MHHFNPSIFRSSLLLFMTILAGCTPSEVRPPLEPASGSLKINAQPAAGAMLIFYPANKVDFDERGTRPQGTVAEDGTFQVTTYQAGDGIPVGEYQIGILWFDNPDSANARDKLMGKFAKPETSGLRVTIGKGTNQIPPIELTKVQLASRAPRNSTDPRDKDQLE